MKTSDDLFDALERCAATSSKKEKLAIVTTLAPFREWLWYALEPTIVYYVDKLPKPTHQGNDTLNEDDTRLLRHLAEREVSGKEALQRIDDTMRELTPKSQEVLRRVLLKDLRCGVGATIVNTAFPGLISVFPYQRCVLEKDSNMAKWNWADGIIVQLKADGMFANVNLDEDLKLQVCSRQGSPFPKGSLGDLEEDLRHTFNASTQTHGELTVYHKGRLLQRQIGNGILNSVLQGGELPADHAVRFDAWDQIPLACAVDKGRYDVPYHQRLDDLHYQIADALDWSVQLIPTTTVFSRAEAMAKCREYMAQGLEGVICKHPKATWRDGDNKDQVKMKAEVDVDLRVEAILPGDEGKKNENRPGRLACTTSCGSLKVKVTVKNEKMREALEKNPSAFINKIMPVRANGVMHPTEDGECYSLFLPRFAEDTPRLDKTEADDLQRVIDQFEAAVKA